MSIPVVSRFWGGRAIPEEYSRYGDLWKTVGGARMVITFGSEALYPHGRSNYFRADDGEEYFPGIVDVLEDLRARDAGRNGIEYWVQVADVLGYLMVWHMGGVYVNCDIEPLRRFDPPNAPWASYENEEDWRIVNAAIGAPEKYDPFWGGLLAGLPERYFSMPGAEMVETTGPAYLTEYANAHRSEVVILPRNSFNPVHWKQVEPGGDASPLIDRENLPAETVGVHHWGHKKDGRSNVVETATQ